MTNSLDIIFMYCYVQRPLIFNSNWKFKIPYLEILSIIMTR